MKIITYQNKIVVDSLKKNGEYKITKQTQMGTFLSLTKPYSCNYFPEAYDYMMNRMKKKIKNKADYEEGLIGPIWGWAKVPDQSEQDYNNKRRYRIVLEIDEAKVLLSCFGCYENFACAGLNYLYYGKTEAKKRELLQRAEQEGKEVIYHEYDKMIRKSHLKHSEYVQATFYKLKMSDVVSIEKVRKKDWKDYRGPYYWLDHREEEEQSS